MIGAITVLLGCQLVGEAFAAVTGLPVPGPVVGMLVLFLVLLAHGDVPVGLATTTEGLLSHMSLLFVPAGVGVMVHLRLLAAEALPIVVALVGSTVLTIAVTALVMKWLTPIPGEPKQ